MTRSLRISLFLALGTFAAPLFGALAGSAEEAKPLEVGARAPGVVLKTADGADFDLGAAFAEKPTLLVFYRGGWCPYCNRHLAALGELETRLLELGYRIIAVSPDQPGSLAPTSEKNKVAYTLLSDRDMKASAAFGLAFKVDAETVAKYAKWDIDLAPVPGGAETDRWLPVPAAYLVGRDGVIKFAFASADYKQRVPIDELIATAKSSR